MAWALKCDICGCYVDTINNPFEHIVPTNSVVRVEYGDYRRIYETCECCATKIKNFIEDMKKENNNAEN